MYKTIQNKIERNIKYYLPLRDSLTTQYIHCNPTDSSQVPVITLYMVSRKPLRVHAYFYNNFGNHRRNWTIISMLHIWTAYETGTGTAFLSQLKTLFIHMSLPKMCRGGRKTLLNQPTNLTKSGAALEICGCGVQGRGSGGRSPPVGSRG